MIPQRILDLYGTKIVRFEPWPESRFRRRRDDGECPVTLAECADEIASVRLFIEPNTDNGDYGYGGEWFPRTSTDLHMEITWKSGEVEEQYLDEITDRMEVIFPEDLEFLGWYLPRVHTVFASPTRGYEHKFKQAWGYQKEVDAPCTTDASTDASP